MTAPPTMMAVPRRSMPVTASRGVGWLKQWGDLGQVRVRGTVQLIAVFGLHVVAYSLIYLGNLLKTVMAAAWNGGCPEECPIGRDQAA